eukprot:scaffold2631_cov412-Prasinococcus_capsulatus_cf.AAC.15
MGEDGLPEPDHARPGAVPSGDGGPLLGAPQLRPPHQSARVRERARRCSRGRDGAGPPADGRPRLHRLRQIDATRLAVVPRKCALARPDARPSGPHSS